MVYNHRTDHSFAPDLEFWRSIENFLIAFPYKTGVTNFIISERFIKYYERRTKESFDVTNEDTDIYGKPLTRKYHLLGPQKVYLEDISNTERMAINPQNIRIEINNIGKIIRFLEKCIKDSERVKKFQHFFESIYQYLVDLLNFNPELEEIRRHGLDDRTNPQFESRKRDFINRNGGIMSKIELLDEFNRICREHYVPFIMFTLYDKCYVVHTTDIFTEKSIQNLPIFLSHPDLQHANELFVEAYHQKNSGNYKECIAKIREGLEAIRDYIYDKYSLTKGTNLHNDMEKLFNNFSSRVFDYTKIPEEDPDKLEKIKDYLRDSVLLTVKFGNFGHHTISNPDLLEENTSYFTLGLIASILPYLNYILK
jgi:hypothetical protein